jgi:mRNA interferase RelE/StbE
MAWYQLSYAEAVVGDLQSADAPMAQRLFDKTKWIASNVENLRHENVADDLPGLCKYAVGDWRIFYSLERDARMVTIHAVVPRASLVA